MFDRVLTSSFPRLCLVTALCLATQIGVARPAAPGAPRPFAFTPAIYMRAGARLYGVNTRDISQGGVKIECDQPLEAGLEVVLTMENFRPLQALVRWCGNGLAGLSFNQLIPFPELMNWLKSGENGGGDKAA